MAYETANQDRWRTKEHTHFGDYDRSVSFRNQLLHCSRNVEKQIPSNVPVFSEKIFPLPKIPDKQSLAAEALL